MRSQRRADVSRKLIRFYFTIVENLEGYLYFNNLVDGRDFVTIRGNVGAPSERVCGVGQTSHETSRDGMQGATFADALQVSAFWEKWDDVRQESTGHF